MSNVPQGSPDVHPSPPIVPPVTVLTRAKSTECPTREDADTGPASGPCPFYRDSEPCCMSTTGGAV